jgi:hypothetical protein
LECFRCQTASPIVNVLLIVANFAVFTSYELTHLNAAVYHASFYPCTVNGAWAVGPQLDHRHVPARRLGSHPGQHAVPGDFGKNVEDAFRSLAYLVFYFAAMMTQTAMTLLFGPAQAVRVPELGASGAVAAVLGAHFVLYPGPQILTYIFPVLRGVLRPRRRVHLRPAGGTAPCPGGTGSTQGAMAINGVASRDPRRNQRNRTPVADMRAGAGSGIVSLVINYQQ